MRISCAANYLRKFIQHPPLVVRCTVLSAIVHFERLLADDRYPDLELEIIQTRPSASSFEIGKAT